MQWGAPEGGIISWLAHQMILVGCAVRVQDLGIPNKELSKTCRYYRKSLDILKLKVKAMIAKV